MPSNDFLKRFGNEAVTQNIVTGYNIYDPIHNSRFEQNFTLHYSHSDIDHAVQLLALLKSEDLLGYVNIEPKTSAFQYLPEWDPIPEASSDYYVEHYVEQTGDDFYISYALEYDLVFEFSEMQMLDHFDTVVSTYAKKSTDNPDGDGLIVHSWWDPYYFTEYEMKETYAKVYNTVVEQGDYVLHTVSRIEDIESVQDWFKEHMEDSMEIPQHVRYVNLAFFRYLDSEGEHCSPC